MKKLFLLFLLIICLIISPKLAQAQEGDASPSAIIKYDLAYPGILPDNPLYKIKVARDKVTELLISNHKRKAEFYLLQADKGILASSILVEKNKIDLAIETALKAENNYTLLVLEVKKMQTKPDKDFVEKTKTAGLKHQEILSSLVDAVSSKNDRDAFGNVLYFSKSNLTTLETYIKKHRFQN